MASFAGMPFLGTGLVFSIVYVWAKENADQVRRPAPSCLIAPSHAGLLLSHQEVDFIFNLARFKVQPPSRLLPSRCSRPNVRLGQAFYLPWAYVGLSLLMGQSPVPHLMGIAAGHLYVFLDKIVPVQYNRTVLWTPDFL